MGGRRAYCTGRSFPGSEPQMLFPLAHKSPGILRPFRGWGQVLVLASLAVLTLVFSLFIRSMVREYTEDRVHTSAIASKNGRTGPLTAAHKAAPQA